jgi:hypothetical protein
MRAPSGIVSASRVSVTSVAARWPEIETVRRWSQSLAVLDAILSPEWEYRYFSFDAHWAADEQLASMRNGSGDESSIVFAPVGAFARAFDHESDMSPYAQSPQRVWPGVVDEVPVEFDRFVTEPAFNDEGVPRVTACLWRLAGDGAWRHGPVTFPVADGDPDGADWLFEQYDGEPVTYRDYALDYWEKEIDLAAISHVYRHEPLSGEVLSALNPDVSLSDMTDDLTEIGYPTAWRDSRWP